MSTTATDELRESARVAADTTRELASLLLDLGTGTPRGAAVAIAPVDWAELVALAGRARANAEWVSARLSPLEPTP